jgi:hypothetical protein
MDATGWEGDYERIAVVGELSNPPAIQGKNWR